MNNHRTITRQRKQDKEKEYRSKILPRAVTSQAILASVCIIFQKKPLSTKKKETREPLSSCSSFCADQSVITVAISKNDTDITVVVTNYLIARETKDHKRLYQDYTRLSKVLQ